MGNKLLIVLYAALLCFIGWALFKSYTEVDACSAKGGTYVKALPGGFVCAKLEAIQ